VVSTVLNPDAPAELVPAPIVEGLRGLAGFTTLGLAAGAGAMDLATALRAPVAVAGAVVAALLLAGPALVVSHPLLGLSARPSALVGALSLSVARAGRLAMGLAPVVLFFAVTTPRWEAALLLAGLWVAGSLVRSLPANLVAAERGAAPEHPASASTLLVAWGWTALLVLVLLRVSWLAATFLVGP
jgi:hypothetical protein